jgi:hypothetical protein
MWLIFYQSRRPKGHQSSWLDTVQVHSRLHRSPEVQVYSWQYNSRSPLLRIQANIKKYRRTADSTGSQRTVRTTTPIILAHNRQYRSRAGNTVQARKGSYKPERTVQAHSRQEAHRTQYRPVGDSTGPQRRLAISVSKSLSLPVVCNMFKYLV